MHGIADAGGLQAGGIYVAGEKYMFIRSDGERTIVGKKVRVPPHLARL